MVRDQADAGDPSLARKSRDAKVPHLPGKGVHRGKRKGSSLHVHHAKPPRRPDRRPWRVTYRNWGSKRKIVRRFKTEPKARAFYKSLWRRRMPPYDQGIEGPSAK
jgi:hypothetical protein